MAIALRRCVVSCHVKNLHRYAHHFGATQIDLGTRPSLSVLKCHSLTVMVSYVLQAVRQCDGELIEHDANRVRDHVCAASAMNDGRPGGRLGALKLPSGQLRDGGSHDRRDP